MMHDQREIPGNYEVKVTFNDKTFFLATPTRLKDFMLGMGMGLLHLPVKVNNRIYFSSQWPSVIIQDMDVISVVFPENY
ncbi:MAG: hypothetical protein RR346_00090 [Bacteroidales bacterium]